MNELEKYYILKEKVQYILSKNRKSIIATLLAGTVALSQSSCQLSNNKKDKSENEIKIENFLESDLDVTFLANESLIEIEKKKNINNNQTLVNTISKINKDERKKSSTHAKPYSEEDKIRQFRHIDSDDFESEEIIKIYIKKFYKIKKDFQLTENELNIVCAVVCAEAHGDGYDYIDAYAVASTILNRARSKNYSSYISSKKGANSGYNFYQIVSYKGQFSVYASGAYKKYLNLIQLPAYQAALDVFYYKNPMHDYLQFRGSRVKVDKKYEQFSKNGNKYFSPIPEDDKIDIEEILNILNPNRQDPQLRLKTQ